MKQNIAKKVSYNSLCELVTNWPLDSRYLSSQLNNINDLGNARIRLKSYTKIKESSLLSRTKIKKERAWKRKVFAIGSDGCNFLRCSGPSIVIKQRQRHPSFSHDVPRNNSSLEKETRRLIGSFHIIVLLIKRITTISLVSLLHVTCVG